MIKAERKNKRTAIIYWVITLSYMGIIFHISALSGHILPFSIEGFDKIFHIGIYAVLAFLCYLSFKKSGVRKYVLLLSIALASIYGITDEFHHLYVPGRDANIGDVFADSFGAFLGSYVANVVSMRKI